MSFLHLLLLFLLLLFLNALAFIFSVTRCLASLSSLFSPLGTCRRVRMDSILRGGLAARCLVSQLSVWSRGALLRRLGLLRCECDSKLFYGRSCTPLPTSIASTRSRRTGAFHLPVIDLAPRGEDGMVASVEETESSASSPSSGRHSAALPIVGPPRGLLARASQEENPFQVFYLSI